jgi:transmembrane sensor
VGAVGVGVPTTPRAIARGRWMYATAAAVLLTVGLSFFWSSAIRTGPSTPPVAELRFSTQHGEQLSRSLADASVLHLNTDTSVTVRFDSTSRWITIERGQVFFEVAHDVKRPFRVIAGSAEVVAVGTKFDVYLQTGSALVTVVDGRVDVGSIAQLSSAEIERAATRGSVRIGAGQQIRVPQGGLPSQPSQVDAQRATAWLRRQIAFDHEPLAVVAAEFNRYAAAPIEIETPALRDRPISGVFAADDAESFVAFLRSLEGVRVEVTSTRIRVSKPAM